MTATEHRQIAITCWLIAAICVGLAVSGPDVWSVLAAVISCGACAVATRQWLAQS